MVSDRLAGGRRDRCVRKPPHPLERDALKSWQALCGA